MATSFVAPVDTGAGQGSGSGAGAAPATPAVPAGAGAGQGASGGASAGSFDIGSILDTLDAPQSPGAPGTQQNQPTDGDGAVQQGVQPGAQAAKPAEGQQQAQTTDPLAALGDEGDEIPTPDKVEGGLHYYKPERVARFVQASKTLHELGNEIPGFSKEVALDHFRRSNATNQLLEDFHSATPEALDQFTGFWGQQNPHALGMMAVRLPGALQKVNPEAYTGLVDGLFDQKFNALYDAAATQARNGGEGQDNLLKALQVIDHHLNGNFRTLDTFKQPSPVDARLQDVEAREQNLGRQMTAQTQARIRDYEGGVVTEVNGAQDSAIEEGLAPVKEYFKDRQNDWRHLVRDLKDKISESMTANPAWKQNIEGLKQRLYNHLNRGQMTEAGRVKEALVAQYRTMYKNVVLSNRKQLISQATGRVVNANQTAHQQHQAAAGAGSEPMSRNGSNTSQGVKINPKDFKTLDDIWDKIGLG